MINELENILNSNEIPNLFYFFGEEEFLVEESAKTVIAKIMTHESDKFNYDVFNADESDQRQIAEIASSFPMMSEQRVVFVKNFHKFFSPRGAKKDELLQISKYIKSPSKSTVMILTGAPDSIKGFNKIKKDPKKLSAKIKALRFPYNFLLENSFWLEFPKIYDSELKSWVTNRSKQKGLKLRADAIEMLIAHTNPSLRELDNELNKIKIYVEGDNKEITIDDVSVLSGANREFNVFELQKTVGKRDLIQSLEIMINMQKSSDQSILITTMLGKYFISLMILSDEIKDNNNEYALAPKIGVSPFFVKDYIFAVKKYSPSELDNAIIAITEADLKLKTSVGSKLTILQDMIMRIIGR